MRRVIVSLCTKGQDWQRPDHVTNLRKKMALNSPAVFPSSLPTKLASASVYRDVQGRTALTSNLIAP